MINPLVVRGKMRNLKEIDNLYKSIMGMFSDESQAKSLEAPPSIESQVVPPILQEEVLPSCCACKAMLDSAEDVWTFPPGDVCLYIPFLEDWLFGLGGIEECMSQDQCCNYSQEIYQFAYDSFVNTLNKHKLACARLKGPGMNGNIEYEK